MGYLVDWTITLPFYQYLWGKSIHPKDGKMVHYRYHWAIGPIKCLKNKDLRQ